MHTGPGNLLGAMLGEQTIDPHLSGPPVGAGSACPSVRL